MFNNKKSKRGFSLVELMVVVAIMGTLAAIAIPAYNGYRKSAKKATYKADLTSLHKAWLAFGVELDSFCERENETVSIGNVGMASLNTSKLYGRKGACEQTAPTCDSAQQAAIALAADSGACTAAAALPGAVCTANWDADAGNAPNKHNFVGFAVNTCSVPSSETGIIGNEGNTLTTADPSCNLGVSAYEMGVYGNISGTEYFGQSVNNLGVLSEENIKTSTIDVADSDC